MISSNDFSFLFTLSHHQWNTIKRRIKYTCMETQSCVSAPEDISIASGCTGRGHFAGTTGDSSSSSDIIPPSSSRERSTCAGGATKLLPLLVPHPSQWSKSNVFNSAHIPHGHASPSSSALCPLPMSMQGDLPRVPETASSHFSLPTFQPLFVGVSQRLLK